MKVGTALSLATEWVLNHGSQMEGFQGAYFSGSTVGMNQDAELPTSSDVDIVVVLLAEPSLKLGKFIYRGALLEVTYLSWNQLSSVNEVLTNYHLAGSFRVDTIITDPTKRLHELQAQVSRHFAEEVWVRRRCENVRTKIEVGLQSINTSAPYYDLVNSWLFPTGITTHLLLVAALRNPTVRCRYVACREVLMEYGHMDFYHELIGLLGCAYMTAKQVKSHVDELAKTFDAAVAVAKTPFFFSTDITPISRPIAIDGSRDMIRSGYHHEAIFWIAATFARCHKIFAADAPELHLSHMPAFEALIGDLGITTTDDFVKRANDVLRFLPSLWEVTEGILGRNCGIVKI